MNWYGHRYLGPGNKLKNGKPVDEDDQIAEIHDNLYNIAKSDEDIREADRDAIKHFLNLNSAHGYLGAAGLAAKYGVESLTGVLYPNMKRKPSEAQLAQRRRYAKVQRQLADSSRDTGLSFREIQQAHTRDAWNEVKQQPGPSNKGQQQEQQQQQHNSPDSFGSLDLPDIDLDDNHFQLFQDLDSMEIDVPSVNGPENTQVFAGSGPSGASGRASGSHQVGHVVKIPRSLAPPPMIITYKKNRIFFSYGICCKRININKDNYFTSPLALVPVDCTAFYLSPSEFQELGNNAFAKECRVKVTPLGIRTAFEYGGTTSGHTTNEFVPVGLVSVGLNKQCEINNVTYTSMNNMQPGGVANVNGTGIVAKYYTDDDAHCNLVTRHTVGYACFLQPQNDQSDGNYHNNNGMMRKDQFVDQFLINTAIGKPIVDYNYKFKHAPLSVPFYNPTNLQREYMYRGGPVTRAFTLKPILNSSNKTVSGMTHTENVVDNINHYHSTPQLRVYDFLEKGGHNMQTGGFSYMAQPQIHVGIQAVPAMTPGLDTTTFQNTSVYWAVEAELDVEIKHGSYYSSGAACQFPQDVTLWAFPNTYNGYPTLSGLVPMPNGVMFSNNEESTSTSTTPTKRTIDTDVVPPSVKKVRKTKTNAASTSSSGTVRKNLETTFSRLTNESLIDQSTQTGLNE